MKITTTHPYRTFLICRGATTADSPVVNPNVNVGEYNRLFYGVSGLGKATTSQGEVALAAGELVDLSAFKGQEITYTSTTDMAAWVAFNPILPNTKLIVSILDHERAIYGDPLMEAGLTGLDMPGWSPAELFDAGFGAGALTENQAIRRPSRCSARASDSPSSIRC